MKADLGNSPGSWKQDHRLEIDQHKNPGRVSHQEKSVLKEAFHQDPGVSSWGEVGGALLRPGAVRIGERSTRKDLSWLKFALPSSVQVPIKRLVHKLARREVGTLAQQGVQQHTWGQVLTFSTHTVNLKRSTMIPLSARSGKHGKNRSEAQSNTCHTLPPVTHKLHSTKCRLRTEHWCQQTWAPVLAQLLGLAKWLPFSKPHFLHL